MAEYKYFPKEVVEALLDTSMPAEKTVKLICDTLEELIDNSSDEEHEKINNEAARLHDEICKNLTSKDAIDRANKMHKYYLDYKILEAREDFMFILTTCNNAALIVIGDALDKVRQLPEFNARFSQMRRAFRHAELEREAYERALRCSDGHWFDPRYFTQHQKKRYAANLTSEEFIEYWQCIGGKAYLKVLDEVNVLRNKFRLSVEAHGYPHAEASAYVLAGASMLMLCEAVFDNSIKRLAHNYCIKPHEAYERLKDFSMNRMMLAWGKCVRMMGPVTRLTADESRNVELTLEQLVDHWNDLTFFYSSVIDAAEEFPEIFRTKGEQKKFLRELLEKQNANSRISEHN